MAKVNYFSNCPLNLSKLSNFIFALVVLIILVYLLPWENVRWGKVELLPSSTITVLGTAESREKTRVATFTAGVSSISDSKDEALNSVNKKVDEIIKTVSDFGIERNDIKTENLNIYQQEETYWEEGRQKTRPGQWRVSSDISIVLREVNKASQLSTLLAKTGATNIYGPSFSLDNIKDIEQSLLGAAIDDAKFKAQKIADATGKKLGRIVSVNENVHSAAYPKIMPQGLGGGGGASLEPGSDPVLKSVSVVFELE